MWENSQSKERSRSIWLPRVVVVDSIEPEVDGVATYSLRAKSKDKDSTQFAPGQFNMLYIPGCGEVAISISGSSHDGTLMRHTIRHVGRVTNAIANLQPGSELGLRGPYGTAWPLAECMEKDVVLVAGGLGLAPLRPVIEAIVSERHRFHKVNLFIGARSPELLLFAKEYEAWTQADINVQVTVDRDPQELGYHTGVVPLLIDRWQPRDREKLVAMVCGPEVMMDYSARSLQNKGLKGESIYLSLERNMQCAVGVCGHCQLGPDFICKNGPVLKYDRVKHYFAVRDL